MYKIAALAYGTGAASTFLYVNHRLRKQIPNPTPPLNCLILYSSVAHGTYWPWFWVNRYLFSHFKPNVPTQESGTIRNQDEQRRVRRPRGKNVQSGVQELPRHHDSPAKESGNP